MTSTEIVFAADLEPGRYVCVRTSSAFGALIRLFTRSPHDHAFIVLGGGLIAEATVWGTRIDTLDSYAGALAVANAAEPLTPGQLGAIAAQARSCAGMEYNWPAIAVIALRLLGAKWGWLLRAADDHDARICSQLVCTSAGAAVPAVDWACGEPDPALVEPAQLARRDPFMVPVAWA